MRRIGLLFAFDFDSEQTVNRIVNYAKENGVICYWFLSHPNSFRIAPPLTISEQEIKKERVYLIFASHRSSVNQTISLLINNPAP
ncbi:MAG: aminotransferase class III-fold pyridoxal phosphate-dependent enzyme [Cytophagales bacterium]|nr:aminotransferase class III-fold pyridoxal phosphate-dependent enzyme [Cytophagales bacterium]